LVGPEGWTTWESLSARVDRKTIARWVDSGRLHRLHPGIYALPAASRAWRSRLEAAVHSTSGVISHRSALALWELASPGADVHLTVELSRSARGGAGVVLHRTRELRDTIRRVDGLPVSCVERSVVDSWTRGGALEVCRAGNCERPRSARYADASAGRANCWTRWRDDPAYAAGRRCSSSSLF
jgi:predicted transcriptional regulator of viral defense system